MRGYLISVVQDYAGLLAGALEAVFFPTHLPPARRPVPAREDVAAVEGIVAGMLAEDDYQRLQRWLDEHPEAQMHTLPLAVFFDPFYP